MCKSLYVCVCVCVCVCVLFCSSCVANGRMPNFLKARCWVLAPSFRNSMFYRVNTVCRVLAYNRRVALSHVPYPFFLCVCRTPDDGLIGRPKHAAEKYNECIIHKVLYYSGLKIDIDFITQHDDGT